MMEFRQKAGTKMGISQKDIQIKVVANWQHIEQPSPAFKRLMTLLLKPAGNHLVETARTGEERQNEQH